MKREAGVEGLEEEEELGGDEFRSSEIWGEGE